VLSASAQLTATALCQPVAIVISVQLSAPVLAWLIVLASLIVLAWWTFFVVSGESLLDTTSKRLWSQHVLRTTVCCTWIHSFCNVHISLTGGCRQIQPQQFTLDFHDTFNKVPVDVYADWSWLVLQLRISYIDMTSHTISITVHRRLHELWNVCKWARDDELRPTLITVTSSQLIAGYNNFPGASIKF